MTSQNIVENKISAIQKYLKILDLYKKFSAEAVKNDLTLKGAVERYLYLVMQATIELSEAVISLNGYRKPTTYSESFHILHEEKIITKALAEKLVNMVGFRNFISHDYEKVNFSIVYDVLQKRLVDIKNFIKAVSRKK